jgi:hypothetical protein
MRNYLKVVQNFASIMPFLERVRQSDLGTRIICGRNILHVFMN